MRQDLSGGLAATSCKSSIQNCHIVNSSHLAKAVSCSHSQPCSAYSLQDSTIINGRLATNRLADQ